MKIRDILKGVDYKISQEASDVEIEGLTDNSVSVKPGYLFVAVRGYSADGHRFIDDAIASGAKAVLAENDFSAPQNVLKILARDTRRALSKAAANFYNNPSAKLKIAGVTGTNGKTTVTYILESIIKCSGKETGVIGTVNYRIKNTVLPSTNTTPGPIDLQRMLCRMHAEGLDYAILEVSSHSLDQGRVEDISFDAAIFTNITSEHMDYHGTLDDYFDAKAKIFGRLKRDGVAILNGDDKLVRSVSHAKIGKIITYGLEGKPDVRAEKLKLTVDGSSFTVSTPEGSINVNTKLIGRHNVSNILASVACAVAFNIDMKSIKTGVELLTGAPGRLEAIDAGQPFRVFVDYAHTEDALKNVLALVREVGKHRIITVFGCGGNRDKTKRPIMGLTACGLSDYVVITSDNPRFEDPADIISDIEKGIKGRFRNYVIEPDRLSAIEQALNAAAKDDIVVIAGKGHEAYQIIKDKSTPFDDRSAAMSILKTLGYENTRNIKDNRS